MSCEGVINDFISKGVGNDFDVVILCDIIVEKI